MSKQIRIVFNDNATDKHVSNLVAWITDALEAWNITAVLFVEDVDYEEGGEDEQAG